MNRFTRALAALSLLIVSACAHAAAPGPDFPDFNAALRVHTDAVQNRDLAALTPTLTTGEELILIFPNGSMTRTREDYLSFHREWFASHSWQIDFEPVWTRVSGDTAQALFNTRYRDTAADGSAINNRAILLMTFEVQDGAWRLISDQNTRAPPES